MIYQPEGPYYYDDKLRGGLCPLILYTDYKIFDRTGKRKACTKKAPQNGAFFVPGTGLEPAQP